MLNKKFLLVLLSGMVLCSYADSNGVAASADDPNQVTVVNRSTIVSSDRTVNNHYSLEVLQTGVVGDNYVRVAVINLDNIPVIVGVSKTNIKNKTFLNILKNAGNKRFGQTVMALNPQIKYRNQDAAITIDQVKTPAVRAYLKSIGYTNDKKVIRRELVFSYQGESMTLTEFMLTNDEE